MDCNSPPCPSPTPGPYSNSCPLSQWHHPTISSSAICFPHLQSFPASGSFQMSQFFASGSQSIGVSASPSVLPVSIQDWSPLGWTGWISLQSMGLSRVFPTPHFESIKFLVLSLLYGSTLTSIHDYWKNHIYAYMNFSWQTDVCALNTLSRFVIAFLPRRKCIIISWLRSPSAVILEPKWNLSLFPFFPLPFAMKWWDQMPQF